MFHRPYMEGLEGLWISWLAGEGWKHRAAMSGNEGN